VCLGSLYLLANPCYGKTLDLASPDGNLVVHLTVEENSEPAWAVTWKGRSILLPSRLGLVLDNDSEWGSGMKTAGTEHNSHDEIWHPVYGERSTIRDHYNALTVHLKDRSRRLDLEVRAYNEGAAVCYRLPRQKGLKQGSISRELTQFRFADNFPCWAVYSAQGEYAKTPLDDVKAGCERPLTVELGNNAYAAVGEARLVDYARMRLRPVKSVPHSLEPDLGSSVRFTTPFTSPWRVVMVGDSPGALLEHNDLFLNLNDPCAIKDTSWIKPGKVIREVTLTTKGGMACVDFAVKHHLQYVEFDAGWYGNENDPKADARTVDVDPKRSKGPLDLQRVIQYAKDYGIGIWLYVNRRHLERQLDDILPLYEQWGVKGVKYGFVQVGSQKWTAWLHEAVRKAAAHHLMVDIHDEYRPTGYSRTYPNLLTQEGVGGNETMPEARHNLVLPFTRYLCGPADYTICWYSDRIKTTHAHQLAASVVFYSPLQFLYWYDRPDQCKNEPELAFFDALPTVWDDSRVIQGKIGQYITMARRKGDEWFVATMNAGERRELTIPLTFLAPGKVYDAFVYSDAAPDGSDPTAVTCRTQTVTATGALKAICAANGGQAVRIVHRQTGRN